MVKSLILTNRELKAIERKLGNKKLVQQDYNYLSRFVRPKLKEIAGMDARELLNKLSYNQRAISTNNKIKKLILNNVREVRAIILYGSVILNNYENYNDIDVLMIVKKSKNSLAEKYKEINNLEDIAKKQKLKLDIQIISEETYKSQYNRNPNLIYQLKNCRVIYGNIKLPSAIEVYKIDLYMKLDYSDMDDMNSDGAELYKALRNIILVRLLSRGVVNNSLLNEIVKLILGEELVNKLKSNGVSKKEKGYILKIIGLLWNLASNELKNQKWEKKEILSH